MKEIRYSNRDILIIILLSLVFLYLAMPLIGVCSISFGLSRISVTLDGKIVTLETQYVFLTISLILILTVLLHELMHIVAMKIGGVKFNLRILKFVAIQLDYDEMDIWKYYLIALSPQILTITTVLTAKIINNPFKVLLILLAIFNFAISSGDFYGVLKTLFKIRDFRGRLIKVGELKYKVNEKV